MDALRAAVPLSRLFLALANSERLVEVRVRARSRCATVRIERGSILSIEGVDGEPLGDALLRQGSLDRAKHETALATRPPRGPVGPWLVAVGAASQAAVGSALAAQLEARLAQLLAWSEPTFELVPVGPPMDRGRAQVQVGLTRAVWHGLLSLCRELPLGQLAALAGDHPLRLTSSGERLMKALAGIIDDAQAAAWLARAPSNAARAPRAVLRALGAAVEASFDGDACNLLLRKQREIRRRVGAHALLDLPSHARSEHARPALRRLAQKLHPDRFYTLDPALRLASQEVMRCLAQAERELLSGTGRRGR